MTIPPDNNYTAVSTSCVIHFICMWEERKALIIIIIDGVKYFNPALVFDNFLIQSNKKKTGWRQ